ncbi:hypothetical protein DXG01_016651, partial [Tephrocybe rancida]
AALVEATSNGTLLESELAAVRATLLEKSNELENITNQYDELEARLVLQSHTSELEEAKSGLSTTQAALAVAMNERTLLQSELNTLKATLLNKSNELEGITAPYKELKETAKHLNDKLKTT